MKIFKWAIGTLLLGGIVALIVVRPLPFLFHHDLPYVGFFGRSLYIILLASCLCLYRVMRGPTGADRIVATDIFGILIVGFCAVLTISTGRPWYIDIGIAWALQSFISNLALAKYLEGRDFDE
ncbi:MAG: cation:proton antiporter [Elusimicrobia bacterium]|nr:cation:proton antiporter [Candidatus Obscuribacterium magneticum]